MKHKKIIFSIIAVVLLATVAYGSTLAWLTDTDEVQNTITLGSVETEIYEEGSGTTKISKIKNVGSNPCLVRARVMISPAEVADDIIFTGKEDTGWSWPSDWSDGNYIYYNAILPAGEMTDSLFTGIKKPSDTVISDWTKKGITTFDITVYEESVQAVVWDGNDEISAIIQNADGSISYDAEKADRIWNIYDSKTE